MSERCPIYCGLEKCTCIAGARLRRIDEDLAWTRRILNDSQEHRQIQRLEERQERQWAERKRLLDEFNASIARTEK